jgi:hypothetical protein
VFFAKRFHEVPGAAQVVARQPRPQVVLDLKLQAAVEPVEVRGAVDVQGRGHLAGKRKREREKES